MLGEGSAQYAIQGLWTAAAYDIAVTFLVLNNAEYAILKWFAELEGVTGAPGARPARGWTAWRWPAPTGCPAGAWRSATSCARRWPTGIAGEGPALVEVGVTPGMALA